MDRRRFNAGVTFSLDSEGAKLRALTILACAVVMSCSACRPSMSSATFLADGSRAARCAASLLHPFTISRTDVSPNPHPLVVAWGGPLVGVGLPIIAAACGRVRTLRAGVFWILRWILSDRQWGLYRRGFVPRDRRCGRDASTWLAALGVSDIRHSLSRMRSVDLALANQT